MKERVESCGVYEVAEIAYLSLRETGIELVVMDDDDREIYFSGFPSYLSLVISTLKRQYDMGHILFAHGVASGRIFVANFVGDRNT